MVLVDKYGADSFRYTLLSSSVMCAENIPFSDKNVEETYKKVVAKLENVLSFYEMVVDGNVNIYDFNLKDIANPMDIWILTRLSELLTSTTKSMDEYRIDQATRPIEKFIDDLSTWWLRRSRERLKSDDVKDKTNSQKVLYIVLNDLSRMIAPFMPFISERIYQSINVNNKNKKESVHLESWPEVFMDIDENILTEMEEVREIVTSLLMIRQKNNLPVRQPLSSATINKNLDKYFEIVRDEVNVKKIFVDKENNLDLEITEELKREGDYRELTRKVKDLRKEKGLTPSDTATLVVSSSRERIDFVKSFEEELKKDCKLATVEYKESDKEELELK
jgi:isoleucyl-tRNA synthetase